MNKTMCVSTKRRDKCFGTEEFVKEGAAEKYTQPLPPLMTCRSYVYHRADPLKPMTKAEETQRFLEYNYAKFAGMASRASMLREYIINRNVALLRTYVGQCRKKYKLNWEDALSESQIHLVTAIDTFNPSYRLRFSTYLCVLVRNSLVTLKKVYRARKTPAYRMATI